MKMILSAVAHACNYHAQAICHIRHGWRWPYTMSLNILFDNTNCVKRAY